MGYLREIRNVFISHLCTGPRRLVSYGCEKTTLWEKAACTDPWVENLGLTLQNAAPKAPEAKNLGGLTLQSAAPQAQNLGLPVRNVAPQEKIWGLPLQMRRHISNG